MTSRKIDFDKSYYFDVGGEGYLKCKICSRILKNERTFNLRKHLLLHKVRVNINQQKNNSNSDQSISHDRKQVMKVEINKKQLIRSYIGLVTEDNIPFNVLNSPNMKRIIDPICQGIKDKTGKSFSLNGNKCRSVLKLVAENIRVEIKKELKHCLLSLKIDSATRLSKTIFGISVQFINNNNIVSRVLGMTQLQGNCVSTSLNFASEILMTLTKYNIKLSQIISITSDNGENMINTTKILSQQCNSNEDNEGSEVEVKIEYPANTDYFEESENVHLENIQICQCGVHTAQLCALDISKNTEIMKYLLQCRNMTEYIQMHSNRFREVFELQKIQLPQLDCPTQWGSTYRMIDQLNKAKEILRNIEVKSQTDDENFDANDSLWDFIDGYSTILKPLQVAIRHFQEEEQLHYGNFYALWLTCKLATNQMLLSYSENKNSISFKIGVSLMEILEMRTTELLSNASFCACLFLDPRFQHLLTDTQRDEAVTFLKRLWNKIITHDPQLLQSTNSSDSMITNSEQESDENCYDLLESYVMAHLAPTNESTNVYTKIETLKLPYMQTRLNVLNFWKDKKSSEPELYALSNVCFAIPPTKVTIERAFSSLDLVLADNRNQLNHETLENILLVKLNSSNLDNAIINLPLFEGEEN